MKNEIVTKRNWRALAYMAVMESQLHPEAVPVYQIPKRKPWWAFWRPTEWETITCISSAQLMRAHGIRP